MSLEINRALTRNKRFWTSYEQVPDLKGEDDSRGEEEEALVDDDADGVNDDDDDVKELSVWIQYYKTFLLPF